MIVEIPDVLNADEVRRCREMLEKASWRDGRHTAGHLAARVKANEQLADDDPLAVQLSSSLLERLASVSRFIAAALPLKVLPSPQMLTPSSFIATTSMVPVTARPIGVVLK